MRFKPSFLTVMLLMHACIMCGCVGNDSYPQAAAVPAVGRLAKCDHCSKEIASVATDNLFEFQGVQYTVCNEACGQGLARSITHGSFSEGHQH